MIEILRYNIVENEPYNIYETSGSNLSNIGNTDNTQDLDIDVDVNLLAYDIDQVDTPYCSNRTTFVRTETPESNLCLAQPENKVKKTWYNQMSKSELNVDPNFATDHACYEMESILDDVTSNVIQATYLGPLKDIPNQPTLNLDSGSSFKAHLPTGLPLTALVDTGCHKTILNRKTLQNNLHHFKNFKKILLREEHKIKLANELIIKTDGLIALPVIIQNYLFHFLVLVTTLNEDFDLILGLESLIQLETNYSMINNTLQMGKQMYPPLSFERHYSSPTRTTDH